MNFIRSTGTVSLFFLLSLGLAVVAGPVQARDHIIGSKELEPVRMQLRWHHQFQFAGYYAAREKGFYEEVGLDVTLVAGSPNRQPVNEVLQGRAQYAEGNGEVLLSRLRGSPLVALSVIFQHSPSVLLTLKSSGLESPADLLHKKVMSIGGHGDSSFIAMFHQHNIPIEDIDFVPSSYQLQDLIDGRTDAFNAYMTNEPYFLEEQGIDYNVINPRDYGIDFYSDILFTSEQEIKQHPDRVRRFKEASLKGWKYAMAHPEEIIRVIRENYSDSKSLGHMRFEALSLHELILPDLVEVGYVNPDRVEVMAKVFLEQGMVDNLEKLDGFIHVVDEGFSEGLYSLLTAALVFLLAALLVAMVLAMFNHRLQKEIRERKIIEQKLEQLANSDSLTGLLNRRAFTACYNDELNRSERYGDVFSVILMDLDFFKRINDRYGHDAGDRVIVAMAALLQSETRDSDLVGRFGGEEFVVLLPKTRVAEARIHAERMLESVRKISVQLHSGETINITVSAGVSEWSPGDQAEATIIKADKALYQAKSAGRDQLVTWQPES